MSGNDFFDKYNLTVEVGDVEVGRVYPLYGMITKILDDSFDNFTIEIGGGISLRCALKDQDSIELIKERAFEPGIFVTEITNIEPVEGHCTTIVFGKKQHKEIS
jgi:hypothetical protein